MGWFGLKTRKIKQWEIGAVHAFTFNINHWRHHRQNLFR